MPSTSTCPALGTRMPVSILIVVDLPAPFGPTQPTISPRPIANDTSRTARTSRYLRYTSEPIAPNRPERCSATRNVFSSRSTWINTCGSHSCAEGGAPTSSGSFASLRMTPSAQEEGKASPRTTRAAEGTGRHLCPGALVVPYAELPAVTGKRGHDQRGDGREQPSAVGQPQRVLSAQEIQRRLVTHKRQRHDEREESPH